MSIVNQLEDIVFSTHVRFEYERDLVRWKTPEYWISRLDGDLRVGKWKGDCEDFALICRAECRALDVPIPTRLVFIECPVNEYFPEGGYHLVAEHEGWLMDVNSKYLISRDAAARQFGYKYLGMSGYNPGDPWHWITNP